MCTHPIKIKSPKLNAGTFLQGVDKKYLVVPCGHCEECQQKRVNDLTFRAYYEYLDTISNGGFVLMECLTYSNDTIPYHGNFYYFRKKDLQDFNKRLRKTLKDRGFEDVHYKYLIVSEYGSEHFRPHYHPLFYVVGNITAAQFDAFVEHCWSCLGSPYVKGCPIGRIDERLLDKKLVNSIEAIKYVCKYIFKGSNVVKVVKAKGYSTISRFVHDICFDKDSKYSFKNLQDWQLRKIWDLYTMKIPTLKEFQLLPFYLQSKDFGVSFLSDVDYNDLFDVVHLDTNSPLSYSNFTLPNYYVRKVFYDYEPVSKRYRLNKLGLDYKNKTSVKLLDYYDELINNNIQLNNYVYKLVADAYTQSLYKDFTSYVSHCLDGRSVKQFAYYSVYLKDVPISPLHIWLIQDDTSKLLDSLEEFCEVVNSDNLLCQLHDESLVIRLFDRDLFGIDFVDPNVSEVFIYNHLPCFHGFDDLYTMLLKMKKKLSEFNADSIKRKLQEDNDKKLALSVIRPQSAIVFYN